MRSSWPSASMPMETGPNFKTHACYWPRNELVLAWPQVNELANQDDLNGLGQSYGSIVGYTEVEILPVVRYGILGTRHVVYM
jgi:hypothetical protein